MSPPDIPSDIQASVASQDSHTGEVVSNVLAYKAQLNPKL